MKNLIKIKKRSYKNWYGTSALIGSLSFLISVLSSSRITAPFPAAPLTCTPKSPLSLKVTFKDLTES